MDNTSDALKEKKLRGRKTSITIREGYHLHSCFVYSPSSINFSDLAAVMSDLCVPLMLSDDCLKVTCSFPDLLASPAKN